MSKNPNHWHASMYNQAFAKASLGSRHFISLAKMQVDFLRKILDLPAKSKILDVPCGVGRHSLLLAKAGYQVTGVDINTDCLKIARTRFRHRNVRYLSGNMNQLKIFKGKFDCVLNLFTSFGYFSTDKENENVLKEMYLALKPGGQIVLNLIDRDFLLKIYQPARWVEEKGIFNIEASRYNKATHYNEAQMLMIDNRTSTPRLLHHGYHRVRLYSKKEILQLMKKVGFQKIKVYGDFKGSPYKKGTSTHPIYIGTKYQ